MVKYSPASLDQTFAALSDPTRRAILARLAHGPLATTEIARPFAMSLPAVLKHLGVLKRAGLVIGERRGRERRYRLQAEPMRDASSWLESYRGFWETQLDALDHYLKESQ